MRTSMQGMLYGLAIVVLSTLIPAMSLAQSQLYMGA